MRSKAVQAGLGEVVAGTQQPPVRPGWVRGSSAPAADLLAQALADSTSRENTHYWPEDLSALK